MLDRESFCALCPGAAEPAKKPGEDQIELIGFERSQPSNRPCVRIGRYVLYEECAGLQERDIDGNLVLGTAKASGMREDGDEGAVCVPVSYTDDKDGANFPLHAEIEKPHFTAARRHFPQLQGR